MRRDSTPLAKRRRRWVGAVAATLACGALSSPALGATPPLAPPARGVWQYQLQDSPSPLAAASGGVIVSLCARPVLAHSKCVRPTVYDVDLYATNGRTANARAARAIRAHGGYAICYVDAGTWESWRPDARDYSRRLLGRPNGWPGERWLNVAESANLVPLIAARVAACARAGFEAVEFDNVDGYTNDTGFHLTAAEQFNFDRELARLAHHDGLAAGLKNDYAQVGQLEPYFDFAIDESCWTYHECAALRPFLAHHKAVFDVEYGLSMTRARQFCSSVVTEGISGLVKNLALLARPWRPCALAAS